MIRKRKIHNPFDFAFGMMYNEFPKELHEELKIPGKFKRKSNVKVRFKEGIIREMDASYIVDPDFKELFETAVVDLEHQSTPVDDNKISIIGDYNIQQIADERLPSLNVIASNLDEEKSVKEYERTPTSTTKLMFLDLGSEDNEERLNILSNIIYNHEEQLTVGKALNLRIIVLFAPRNNACTITRQVVELYLKIKNKPKKLEYTLYSVISAMIDAYFDEEEEFEELMNMINNETADEIIGKFESEIILENRLAEWEELVDKVRADANAEVDRVRADANAEVDRVRADANAEVDRVRAENILLKAKIKELETQLSSK